MRKIILLIIPILFTNCRNNSDIIPVESTKNTFEKGQINESKSDNNIKITENDEAKNIDTTEINLDAMQKATIDKRDSLIWLKADMKLDHRIFGYKKPDVNSQKLILLSIFTNEVKNNPFNCKYGAFYETSEMGNIKLKFIENIGDYSKIEIITADNSEISFVQNKWIEINDYD